MKYEEAKSKAHSLRDVGITEIYLHREDAPFPWHLATSMTTGGSHRLDMSTTVAFMGVCPETEMPLRWHFDVEKPGSNGKGYYMLDTEGCREVSAALTGPALAQWKEYLRTAAGLVRAKGEEWRGYADKQARDALELDKLWLAVPEEQSTPPKP